MKNLLFLFVIAMASPAFACSCQSDDRTLEERIDDADRILRVKVVAAELEGEMPADADPFERLRSERITYRLRTVESLKGDNSAPPRMSGQAGSGGGDCTVRLAIGAEIILFVARASRDISFNYCSQPYEPVAHAETDLRLQSLRAFVQTRTPIHACDNLPRSRRWDVTPECKARQEAAGEAWRARAREEAGNRR